MKKIGTFECVGFNQNDTTGGMPGTGFHQFPARQRISSYLIKGPEPVSGSSKIELLPVNTPRRTRSLSKLCPDWNIKMREMEHYADNAYFADDGTGAPWIYLGGGGLAQPDKIALRQAVLQREKNRARPNLLMIPDHPII